MALKLFVKPTDKVGIEIWKAPIVVCLSCKTEIFYFNEAKRKVVESEKYRMVKEDNRYCPECSNFFVTPDNLIKTDKRYLKWNR